MRRVLVGFGLGLLALVLLVVARTAANRPEPRDHVKRVVEGGGFPDAPARLAGAIRYPTASLQDTSGTDTTAFVGLHDFLRAEYPHAFGELQVETISDLSLLLTWQGSSSALQPVLVMGHLDVVPAGADSLWSQPPFAGVVTSLLTTP